MFDILLKTFLPKNQAPAERRESVGKFAGILGIILNIILCAAKIFAGVISGSISIVADALNNLADALSSGVTVICFKLSGKPADEDHPYGHQRIEYVATLFLAFLILFIGYELIKTSVGKIINPEITKLNSVFVVVVVLSVLIKFVMSRMYLFYAKTIKSSVLKAASQDSLNDALATFGILIAGVLSKLLDFSLDGYAGVVISLLIIWSGISLVRDGLNPILGSAPDKEMVSNLEDTVLSYEGIIGIHDLIVHNYGPNKFFASVHAEVDAKEDMLTSHDLIDNIEREVNEAMGIELVIHMDPVVTDDERVNELKEKTSAIVEEINPRLSIHDFRVVIGNTHTNLIFDVVLPFKAGYGEIEVKEKIEVLVKEKIGKEYFCVISIDRDITGIR